MKAVGYISICLLIDGTVSRTEAHGELVDMFRFGPDGLFLAMFLIQ